MRYFVTIAYEPSLWSEASEETRKRYHEEHLAFHEAVAERAHLVAGEALAGPETATTLRHSEGRPVLAEGPFAETAEVVGGFYLVDADNLDVMTGLCELLPKAYSLEIRPVVQVESFETR
ncbi:MAG TPA: YciI family protein [Pedococcus sp.]|nr:YciI family protein [Pedococcus sp.]